MKTLWVDAGNGAAGDMLLGALLDAGADLAMVRAALAGLPVEPLRLEVTQVRRHGLRASHVTVHAPATHTTRNLSDIVGTLDSAALPAPVRAFARACFVRLAEAEARVHGVAPTDVHFHEVGALDAIADVVGCAAALHDLGLLHDATRAVSPIAVGSGRTDTAHGPLPLPAPAVLELLTLAGAPIRHHDATIELCTPTGAALLATLATRWGPAPGCVPRAVGVGAGTADPAGHPNVLRVLIGDAAHDSPDWQSTRLNQVETTVDDLDPRIWPDLLAQLRGAGAADAWCTPALTHKGRPGHVLSVLVDEELLDLVCHLIFTQTTTLGVRMFPVDRRALRRDQVSVPVGDGLVRVKRGYLGDRVVTVQPEYDDALAQAIRSGVPLSEVLDQARQMARGTGSNSEVDTDEPRTVPESGYRPCPEDPGLSHCESTS